MIRNNHDTIAPTLAPSYYTDNEPLSEDQFNVSHLTDPSESIFFSYIYTSIYFIIKLQVQTMK